MITIRVEGFKELQSGLARAADQVEPVLSEAIRKAGVLTKQNIARKAPVFDGNLKRGIQSKPSRLKTIVSVGPKSIKYGYVQEYGRTSKKMPPSKALEKFAQIKLGDSKLAFVLARSIARKGTKPHPFFWPGFDKSKPGIVKLLDQAGSKIVEII